VTPTFFVMSRSEKYDDMYIDLRTERTPPVSRNPEAILPHCREMSAMTMRATKSDPWSITVFQFEASADPALRLQESCSELLGATHKLAVVGKELRKALSFPDLVEAFEYADYQIENYLTRLYSLLERAYAILSMATGLSAGKLKQSEKDPGRRARMAPQFESHSPEPTRIFLQLLDVTDSDIGFRNSDTHEMFFHLRVTDGQDYWPIASAIEAATQAEHGQRGTEASVHKRLRSLLERFVEEYSTKIQTIIDHTETFLAKLAVWETPPCPPFPSPSGE